MANGLRNYPRCRSERTRSGVYHRDFPHLVFLITTTESFASHSTRFGSKRTDKLGSIHYSRNTSERTWKPRSTPLHPNNNTIRKSINQPLRESSRSNSRENNRPLKRAKSTSRIVSALIPIRRSRWSRGARIWRRFISSWSAHNWPCR